MKNNLGETLEESLNNPESWLRQAEQQFLVADSIADKVRNRGASEKSTLMSVGFLKTTTLLLALCVENSFKGVKAANHMFTVDGRGLSKKTRGGGGSGHSLLDHANEIGFSLTEEEMALLERLSEVGIWAGKYHAPIHHKAFEKSCSKNSMTLTLPRDLHMVKSILARAALLSKVSTVV